MKRIFLFLFLCLLGFSVAELSNQDVNPTSLLMYHDAERLHTGPIVPGRDVSGEFTATENNLAIVRIRLRTYNRFNTTHLVFQLRQKGNTPWLVTNTYALDRLQDGLLYPFGFPPIADSIGRAYELRLSSPDGTGDNAAGVPGSYHVLAAQYVQPIPGFIGKKILSTVRDPYNILYISMFMVPALMVILKAYRFPLFIYLAFVYVYLPVAVHSNAVLYLAAAGLFAGNTFLIGALMLVQIPIMLFFRNDLAATRLATLVFFSLVTGLITAGKDFKDTYV